jgi:glycosyltransferase involved in cell wall biosynthesis
MSKKSKRENKTPKISIIVPFYNCERTIGKTIKSLLKQDYPREKYEIILVDDGSTGNTVEVVKKFKGIKLILQKHAGPAVARNRGVRHSKGDILLFTDADCIANKNWIKNMIKPFENEKVVGACGTYKTANDKNIISRFVGYEIEDRHNGMAKQHSIDFVGTFSAAYRRKTFLEFGGFDEDFRRASGEDMD